jgi:hypothetical protein
MTFFDVLLSTFYTPVKLIPRTPSLNVGKAGATCAAWGDPDIGAGWSFRFRDWKIEASIRWTFPFGIWNVSEAEAKCIHSGSLYHRMGLASSFTRYMDPVAVVLPAAIT